MAGNSKTIFNPSAKSYTTPPDPPIPSNEILVFHKTLPSYTPTPLIPLAQPLPVKIKNLLLKDERTRFTSLPSFKPLGIAWAIRNALISELSESLPLPLSPAISLPDLAAKAQEAQITLITATDGKLGRIIAKLGKYFGIASINTRIFVADDLEESVRESIRAEGAEVIVVAGNFEVALREAWLHSVATDGVLVLIDAEENYEDIPKWIVEGYDTIFQELDAQLQNPPDLIVLPVGVGGLAQAGISHYKRNSAFSNSNHSTKFLTVEPEGAACLFRSLEAEKRVEVDVKKTILKHLSYGSVSQAAWEILKGGVDGSTVVSDSQVSESIEELGNLGVEVGGCGGAVLAALKHVLGEEELGASLGLDENSTVVLICTDGKCD